MKMTEQIGGLVCMEWPSQENISPFPEPLHQA